MSEERDSTAPPRAESGTPTIAAMLRTAAVRAAECTGGQALVFAHAQGGEPSFGAPPLRAAAGFTTPEQARAAAQRLRPFVQDAYETGRRAAVPAGAGLPDGATEGSTLPLAIDGRIRGVLLVTTQGPPGTDARETLDGIV